MPLRRWAGWAWLAALLLLAGGCSLGKLGYDTMPTWLGWQVDNYLSLDHEQQGMVDRHLSELHRWHRQTQLVQYAGFLREVDDTLRKPVDGDEVGRWRERAAADGWTPVAERLAGPLAELIRTLRPEQVAKLRKRFEEDNRKHVRENLPTSGKKTVLDARVERLVKRAEFFLGDLTDEQRHQIRERAAGFPASEQAWLAEREERQQGFLALVDRIHAEQPDPARAERQCLEYLKGLWTYRDPKRRALLQASARAGDALSAELLAQATPDQRGFLSKKLRNYARDFSNWERLASN